MYHKTKAQELGDLLKILAHNNDFVLIPELVVDGSLLQNTKNAASLLGNNLS